MVFMQEVKDVLSSLINRHEDIYSEEIETTSSINADILGEMNSFAL